MKANMRGFPLEGKLSLKATDEVSPMRNCSYFNRKQTKFDKVCMSFSDSGTTITIRGHLIRHL